MDWHSTRTREELLIAVSGRVHVEVQLPTYPSRRSRRANRCIVLQAGQCALLPRQTVHRVVNRSAATSRYLYVTGPSRP
jgi:mannose-6-phosphate isomerase-like protein (cupin superfamily)